MLKPLCNHCNLQKRQINIEEKNNNKLYSAKSIKKYQMYEFEFPWEKKSFDETDSKCKEDTYWYDLVEFQTKIYYYGTFRVPINKMVKKNFPLVL